MKNNPILAATLMSIIYVNGHADSPSHNLYLFKTSTLKTLMHTNKKFHTIPYEDLRGQCIIQAAYGADLSRFYLATPSCTFWINHENNQPIGPFPPEPGSPFQIEYTTKIPNEISIKEKGRLIHVDNGLKPISAQEAKSDSDGYILLTSNWESKEYVTVVVYVNAKK